MRRILNFVLVVLGGLALASLSGEMATGTPQNVKIKKIAIRRTPPHSGEAMYREYCAVCHGEEGKGNGPAASQLKVPPADLSILARRNNGKFPGNRVASVLRYGIARPLHDKSDMPTWSSLFKSLDGGPDVNEGILHLRISNLTEYIRSLQVK